MKKSSTLLLSLLAFVLATQAQTPYQRVYNTLNTKCNNSTCHNNGCIDFSVDDDALHLSIFNTVPQNTASEARHERVVKQGHPYMSFLLRKIAGASFDTDLALDANDGALMNDINGQPLTNKEIEYVRQWIMCGAKKTYSGNEVQPSWQNVSDYYDNPIYPFLPKPPKPNAGEGLQFRMGPILIPYTGSGIEVEYMTQQEVNFPFLSEVYKIDGFMNQQSHHFLLFKFDDSLSAAQRGGGNFQLEKITFPGTSSFDGNKSLTTGWQDDTEFDLPTGTALFWEQKAYLDMNYHVKNYNATSVLPCDFYFNVYFNPRNPQTIEMKSALVNNALLGFFTGGIPQGPYGLNYDDESNNDTDHETRYIWNLASHTHKYGTDYDIVIRRPDGDMSDTIYEGFYNFDYTANQGFYDWEHPPVRTIPGFEAVEFGKYGSVNAGLVASTHWNVQEPGVMFGFTTDDEMQLFYYMYTSEMPGEVSVSDLVNDELQFSIYPNPNNGNGTILYTLTEAAEVEATVSDISGRVVAELLKEHEVKGTHNISLSQSLNKGMYIATLKVNGVAYSKKFVVSE